MGLCCGDLGMTPFWWRPQDGPWVVETHLPEQDSSPLHSVPDLQLTGGPGAAPHPALSCALRPWSPFLAQAASTCQSCHPVTWPWAGQMQGAGSSNTLAADLRQARACQYM